MKSSSASANPQFSGAVKVSMQILLLLGVLLVMAFVVASLGGDASARDVGTTLFWCGLGVLAVGIFSIGGTHATERGFSAQMAQTLDADTTGARARRAGAKLVL